jgi:hypothetical protein
MRWSESVVRAKCLLTQQVIFAHQAQHAPTIDLLPPTRQLPRNVAIAVDRPFQGHAPDHVAKREIVVNLFTPRAAITVAAREVERSTQERDRTFGGVFSDEGGHHRFPLAFGDAERASSRDKAFLRTELSMVSWPMRRSSSAILASAE